MITPMIISIYSNSPFYIIIIYTILFCIMFMIIYSIIVHCTITINYVYPIYNNYIPNDDERIGYIPNNDDQIGYIPNDDLIGYIPNDDEQINYISNDEQIDYSHQSCCICLKQFIPSSNTSKLRCSHVYHQRCIIEWLKYQKNCPICRTYIV